MIAGALGRERIEKLHRARASENLTCVLLLYGPGRQLDAAKRRYRLVSKLTPAADAIGARMLRHASELAISRIYRDPIFRVDP